MIQEYLQNLYQDGFMVYCLGAFISGWAISALLTIAKRMLETI